MKHTGTGIGIEGRLEAIHDQLEIMNEIMIMKIACEYPNQEFDEYFFKRVAKIQAASVVSWLNDQVKEAMYDEEERIIKMLNKKAQTK